MEIALALLLAFGLSTFFSGDTLDELPDDAVDPEEPVDPVEKTFGTDGDDTVVLTEAGDDYDGLGGNDSIRGGAGDDTIDGGSGFDTISGDEGNDVINGGFGKDVLYGRDGYDTITGGEWHDSLYGGEGFDDLYGGLGKDFLIGNDGKDLLVGGEGDDELRGGSWHDGLFGGEGDDILRGNTSNDVLEGGAGDDLLLGGPGSDIVFGGAGSDDVYGGDGDDLIAGSVLLNRELDEDDFEAYRSGDVPDDENGDPIFTDWGISGSDADTAADTLSGGNGDDIVLIGNNDIVFGGDGADDFILGDWITEGNAAEIMDFNSGEDVIVVAVTNPDAVITTETVDGQSQVLIDGVVVANVSGSFDADGGLNEDLFAALYTPEPVLVVDPPFEPVVEPTDANEEVVVEELDPVVDDTPAAPIIEEPPVAAFVDTPVIPVVIQPDTTPAATA